MPVRNQNWYNLQSTRRYPLDDKSTGVDDSGAFIRDDIIVDCHIRFPNTLGDYLYVQGITISENLVTIIFGAATNLNSNNNPTIAALTVSKPAETNVHYDIAGLVPGVSGWLVLGSGIATNFVGRYSTAAQTYVGLRNARPYRPLPIPTLGKINLNSALTDLVRLTATSPVTAEYIDEYLLPENARMPKYDPATQTTTTAPIRAIRFSTEAPNAIFNPLTNFLGPCSQRPESGTCPKRPIERINGVQPDCINGNINIVGDNGLSVRTFEECGGIDITTNFGLEQACQTTPKTEKRPEDKCPCPESNNKTEYYCWPPFDPANVQCEENNEPCPLLPICTSFSPCHETLFEIVSGSFRVSEADAPPVCCPTTNSFSSHEVFTATSVGTQNIALYRGCASDWAFNHTISVDVKPIGGGRNQNGGVVINYMRVTEGGRCKTKYIAVVIDIGASELQIYRFTGTTLIKENRVNVVANQGDWYKISVTAVPAGENDTTINAVLYNLTTNATLATLSTTVIDYEAVNGKAGLFTNSGAAHFNRFEVI